MNSVLTSRQKIYDHIQDGSNCHWTDKATHDQYITYCVAKDTIQDTAETVLAHRARGFSSDVHERYLEYYGILQALYMQQDAISALHKLFLHANLSLAGMPSWDKLRNLRNDTAGHPVGRKRFLNRNIIGYNTVNYSAWPSGSNLPKSENVSLGILIDAYTREATNVLDALHNSLIQSCSSGHV